MEHTRSGGVSQVPVALVWGDSLGPCDSGYLKRSAWAQLQMYYC